MENDCDGLAEYQASVKVVANPFLDPACFGASRAVFEAAKVDDGNQSKG
jgi:hypothetical protein